MRFTINTAILSSFLFIRITNAFAASHSRTVQTKFFLHNDDDDRIANQDDITIGEMIKKNIGDLKSTAAITVELDWHSKEKASMYIAETRTLPSSGVQK